jgi:type I restriction-modification system DNA methylase subunit
MIYSSISIQGNIITSEILEKIRIDDIRFQKNTDFGLASNATLRDEINMAWTLAQSNWQAFKTKRDALKDTDTGTTETRRYWVMPLLSILGYDVSLQQAQSINEKSYAISHGASNKEFFPIHIIGCNQNMDTRPDAGTTRLSAHALTQEYLNNIEHLYALVSNGKFLRLLRDATRLSRLSYLEFNLEQMMEEGLYVEFALLYRTLHATRMPMGMQAGPESIIEFYHQEAIASGSRIRERLSQAVEVSIQDLANGLLQHSQNHKLVTAIDDGTITAQDFYLYNLRLVYRLLFLLVIEERKLIYPEQLDQDAQQKRDIYYNYYSLQRLAKLCDKQLYIDPNKNDLWLSVLTTFALFEDQKYGTPLGIAPLGAGIFAPDALGIISGLQLSNQHLLHVLKRLVSFETKNQTTVRVNYADLDVEEFGSVYEGLLEYAPQITNTIGQLHFGFVQGTSRSSSGSHYTPEELVKPLIKHSLDYLIADKLKEPNPEAALLSLTVCDVACGSGHILLSAARRIGWELACLRETNANKNKEKVEQPSPTYLRQAIRDAIRHCIYGVDLNPLAVELCKVALWLEAHAPGEPLNFLDHHIKCGNAIVGLAHANELDYGIATEAFKTLESDDKDFASTLRKTNIAERKAKTQLGIFNLGEVDENLKGIQKEFTELTNLPENTPEQISQKVIAYNKLIKGPKWWRIKQLADLQIAQFFIQKILENKENLTTDAQYVYYLKNGNQITDRGASLAISEKKRFFHWFLEYPEVFAKGGFDCILGNPPFLGDRRLKEAYGEEFLEWIRYKYTDGATVDLVVYFFLRINDILIKNGFQSLISTNTIAQGKARELGIEKLMQAH